MRNLYALLVMIATFAVLILSGCSREEKKMEGALQSIVEQDLLAHIQTLSSDGFEGRAPSSRGEEKTIGYLKEQFQRLGLQPGNRNSYFQEVPLVEVTANLYTELQVSGAGRAEKFDYARDFVAVTRRLVEQVSLKNSEMVFVGYGIVAPEYDWNDYEGLDVKGKTVIVLVNDPGYAAQDSALFNGKAMTYYGRWSYKYEEAARQGAEAIFVIHETGPAGYPWSVVENSWQGGQFYLESEDNNMSRCAVEGWLTNRSARKIFQIAGVNFDNIISNAAARNFSPTPLGVKASFILDNTIRHSTSNNVLALLPGKGRADEYIIYTAHWDHLGVNPSLEGDSIYNGAMDNATGAAALLEMAEAFSQLPNPPKRSILFLALTAEEQGLLGSRYYAENPVYPLNKTVAAINMDGMNIWGRMKDVTIIGYGNSELDGYVFEAAKKQGRVVRPDPEPEKGYFYRSDHFSFAKQGVPALYVDMGIEHVEHGKEWTLQQITRWTAEHYHKPSDEYDPEWWDLSGLVDDVRLLFRVGYRLGNEDKFPNWREGNEFRAKRDALMER